MQKRSLIAGGSLVRAVAIAALLILALGASAQDFYWEDPAQLSSGQASFPQAAAGGGRTVIAWQETESAREGAGSIWLSMATTSDGITWKQKKRFAGPYPFSGSEPSLFTLAVSKKGEVAIAVSSSEKSTTVLVSRDADSFSQTVTQEASATSVAPRIFYRTDGGLVLFVTQGSQDSLSLSYSVSADGSSWGDFRPFLTDNALKLNFLPSFTSWGGKDYVAFQSLSQGDRPSFQIYLRSSDDGCETWSPPTLITDFQETVLRTGRLDAPNFDNQRAFLTVVSGSLVLAWERKQLPAGNPQAYYTKLGPNGKASGELVRVSSGAGTANNPQVIEYQGKPLVVWFDDRKGTEQIYMSTPEGIDWKEETLSPNRVQVSFARPMSIGGKLYFAWQVGEASSRVVQLLAPDLHVDPPRLTALNFAPSVRTRGDRASLAWNVPRDSSGVAGFSYLWSRDPKAEPPDRIGVLGTVTSATEAATEDGPWYFAIRATDFAGNWSETSRIAYVRDTTPPEPVHFNLPDIDEAGFLPSNSFSLSWVPPKDKDLAGYTYSLQFAGPIEMESSYLAKNGAGVARFEQYLEKTVGLFTPPNQVITTTPQTSFTNQDNGLWFFTVSAIDTVGNISQPETILIRLKNYVPYTYITFVDAKQDELGKISFKIIGRGFSEGGQVERIVLSRSGKEPWDYSFERKSGAYRVDSDRLIDNFEVEDIEAGTYRIGLVHPTRGLYFAGTRLTVESGGTVKFGDFSTRYEPSWKIVTPGAFALSVPQLFLLAALAFVVAGMFFSIHGIARTVHDGMIMQKEVLALLTGDVMPLEKKKKIKAVRRRGVGLRLKFASFTLMLVVLIILLVSIPLSVFMTNTQEAILAMGLKQRANVLLESLTAGAKSYLPTQSVLELGLLPGQTAALEDAKYATITGYSSSDKATIFSDHIWATNDPDILKKSDTAALTPGVSRLTDPLSPQLPKIADELNAQAKKDVSAMSQAITDLTQEALKLALKTDQASVTRRDEIQNQTRQLETRLNAQLSALSSDVGSVPAFDTQRLNRSVTKYLFYKPVLYRRGGDDTYFRGMVRLEVSTDRIIAEVDAARTNLLRITILIALIVVGVGIVGAFILASIILLPVNRLVKGVETIRDTEDKEKLEGHVIDTKTHDELATLAETINQMTTGLVKAAAASKDLTVGKEIQKMFIPLDLNSKGEKSTTGSAETEFIELFGYYEGAKGVSGDYFDFLALDNDQYALIKCDVAGKGVPAALIMIEVATLFSNYFASRSLTKESLNLSPIVTSVNKILYERAIKGRFAAFNMCLLNQRTGDIRYCNAGDNLVHMFDGTERKMKTLTLPEQPAAGVMDPDLIDMRGGYRQVSAHLKSGDVLLLYTDGIEEAKRHFRLADLTIVPCAEPGLERDQNHVTHSVGQEGEELGNERLNEILTAYFDRKRYSLEKFHNPNKDEHFDFDFSACTGTVKDAVIAMVSVEKVFRLYSDPAATDDDVIRVDKKIDEFLKTHFAQYKDYFRYPVENTDDPDYIFFRQMKEDDQYDDLTILAIRKK
jgi:hypothetical protein